MPKTVSDQVLAEINAAEEALAQAVAADAQAATDLANVHTAQTVADGSAKSALASHSNATALAQRALSDLRNELQFTGDDGGSAQAATQSFPGRATGTKSAFPQHPLVTHALNLGLSWSVILQALLSGGMAALQNLVNQSPH